MKHFLRSKALIAMIALAMTLAVLPEAIAQCTFLEPPTLYGTLGACDNARPGAPCTRTSTLVELDPWTGALIRQIGTGIGYTVNGLAWDHATRKLYATTAVGDAAFHGLIVIDPRTGIGKPVNSAVVNFGLPFTGTESPIHSITIDSLGNMVGWYDELESPSDTFVRINKRTGKATEFPNTGIDTSQNGVSFSDLNLLWNIDSPRIGADGTLTQTAYLLNPLNGKPLLTRSLSPPTNAALGDFHPASNLYYGLNFIGGKGINPTSIVVVDMKTGVVTGFTSTISDLHTIAFAK